MYLWYILPVLYLQAITGATCTLFIIILAVLIIKTQYKLIHYLSIVIATFGMVVVILQDIKGSKDKGIHLQVLFNTMHSTTLAVQMKHHQAGYF